MVSPSPIRAWTVEDLDDDGVRREIFDGPLLVQPPAEFGASMSRSRLCRIFDELLPDQLKARPGQLLAIMNFGLELREGATFCVPALMVFRIPEAELVYGVKADAVVLVVEVLSSASRRIDLVLKRHEYRTDVPFALQIDPASVC